MKYYLLTRSMYSLNCDFKHRPMYIISLLINYNNWVHVYAVLWMMINKNVKYTDNLNYDVNMHTT